MFVLIRFGPKVGGLQFVHQVHMHCYGGVDEERPPKVGESGRSQGKKR